MEQRQNKGLFVRVTEFTNWMAACGFKCYIAMGSRINRINCESRVAVLDPKAKDFDEITTLVREIVNGLVIKQKIREARNL